MAMHPVGKLSSVLDLVFIQEDNALHGRSMKRYECRHG